MHEKDMENSQVYNLEKLKWVLWGMMIPVIGGIISIIIIFFNEGVENVIMLTFQVVGYIILVLGLKSISI